MSESASRPAMALPGRKKPIIIYLFVMLLLVAFAATVAVQTYQQTQEAAVSRLNARADLARELVTQAFTTSDYGLRTLAGFIEPLAEQASIVPGSGLESLEQTLDQKRDLLEYLDGLFVMAPQGRALYSSESLLGDQVPGWSFLRQQLSGMSGSQLITPLYKDPTTGQLSIWHIRALYASTGAAAAYLAARQTPELLTSSLSHLSLSEGQTLAVLDENMTVVGRLPGTLHTGTRVKEPHTKAFVESGQARSHVITSSPVDSEERFYAFRRVSDAPYIVIVGEKMSVVMSGWWQNLWVIVIGVLLVGIMGLVLVCQLLKRQAAEQKLIAENQERLALQHSAQSNEARLRALIHSIPDLIFVFDELGRFVFVHATDESTLLRPVEELLGTHYQEVLPAKLANQLDVTREQVERTGEPADLEYQLEYEGEVREFSARITVLVDQENRNNGFLAVVRDVTESKIQEAELRIASTAFETHLGIVITDDNGVILRANRAFTKITGYEEHEVVGKTPAVLQSGVQDRAFYQNFWARVKENGSWEGEIWNRKKNGEIYAEWLTVTAVRGEGGHVLNYVGTFHDITKRKEAERQAHRLAFYDSLTGLANRVLLEDRIAEAVKSNERQKTYAALLQLELNQFRAINDTRGYEVGDLVLKTVADRLGKLMRGSNTLARIGGDEFAILLLSLGPTEEAAARAAEVMADQVLSLFEHPVAVAGHNVPISVSVGITLMSGQQVPWDQQIQRAEQATQQAKQQARQQGARPVAFFDPEIQARTVENILLEDELRNALSADQLQLYFQPQIRNPDWLQGYEVLLRWQHPEKGLISPGVFIPLAEQSRLIVPIGEWVLRRACEQLARWQDDPATKDLYLAVNVSVYQFQNREFTGQVAAILEETGAPPHLLELEVTESLLMDDPEYITQVMNDLRALGIRFSLDDFGTGYSSLSYLKRLPLDQVKIDQSFTRDLGENSASGAIVDSIIGLSSGLGLQVIAEGVETEAQRDWLVEHGCRHFQGYLFGRPGPLPADN
ncbi:MAG: PAS/PAC sensor-containing diguanylate cyclase/phosphodiesterase [Marinobacter sp. T13-3]|nr:MAG: PAS/PAC sensor-containing diguanylate cyclase/phosphodiesterase [Marinobacter sp. T13-3]